MGEPAVRAPPLALTGFLPAWDIERRRADLTPVIAWTLDQIRRLGHPVERLGTLHRHLDATRAHAVAQALTAASLAKELRRYMHRVVLEAVPEIPAERVGIQTHTHFRILVPHDAVAPVPPHTDFGFGHALAERNVWLSLTDAKGSAALHVLSLGESLSWLARTGKLRGVLDGAPEIPPVPTRAGDVLLFTPLHLHRARPPSADLCRISVDVRLLPRPTSMRDLSFSPLRSHRCVPIHEADCPGPHRRRRDPRGGHARRRGGGEDLPWTRPRTRLRRGRERPRTRGLAFWPVPCAAPGDPSPRARARDRPRGERDCGR